MVNFDQPCEDQALGRRCSWCGEDPLMVAYHDREWGFAQFDSRALWETLCLETFQAGLSWAVILRKRPAFRAAFAGFDPARVARFGPDDAARLAADSRIVRHRGKIEAVIASARAWIEIESREGFAAFVWARQDWTPRVNAWRAPEEIPAFTAQGADLAKALRARGMRWCGPTTVYAFMQAAGLVNDHLLGCPARAVAIAAGQPPSPK
ncbi:DNA-3-methyladenine glycosylase I [Oceanicella actignis]|uniref:DNA-3-methyladenine glycosylase I n=1 Tax=Oceanicella actignis TaxID=1189325 RepID=UPI0011E79276|nr:DNA-3-methyladenine glycosylase I [Oceanicella actignis]